MNKPDIFNFTPIFILAWSLVSLLVMPTIPVASGFGWDGVFYGKVALDFQNMIGSIDSYRANRIVPSIFIHYLFVALDVPLNLKSVLLGFKLYNIFILVWSSILWVLISKRLMLKTMAKWIGFSALFINYPILNLHFYYPALTDGTAFFIGMSMLYAHLAKKSVLLLAVTMLSFFCWPAGIIGGLILFVYSESENVSWYFKNKETPVIVFLMLLSPFLAFIGANFIGEIKHVIVQTGLDGKVFKKFADPESYKSLNLVHLTNACLNAAYLVAMYWLILKNFDLIKFIKSNFTRRFLPKIIVAFFILIILTFLKGVIYSPAQPTLTPFEYFASYYFIGPNVRFPFQFVFGHISYWGPIVFLFILFFREFVEYMHKCDLPVMLIFLVTVLFSINSESRPIIIFYPFVVVVILQVVDLSKFRSNKGFAILFSIVSIVYTKVWLHIELPSSVFPEIIMTDLDKFPMQWHFMNFGYFTNALMYWVHAAVAIVLFIVFTFIMKKPTHH